MIAEIFGQLCRKSAISVIGIILIQIENLNGINNLFLRLGFQLDDYHNASSHCAGVGSNGTTDELEGLVNFMKGTDYFDYDGDCNITEVRDHVLGDIYHSQLIEIGSPDGSTQFTDDNQEAYLKL